MEKQTNLEFLDLLQGLENGQETLLTKTLPKSSSFWINYWVYLTDLAADINVNKSQPALSTIQRSFNDILTSLDDHMWNWDVPQMKPFTVQGIPCLFGSSRTLQCSADVNTVVYILRELSKKHPQAAIRITDETGEFLLALTPDNDNVIKVEDPDMMRRKVWIMNGEIVIIQVWTPITLRSALKYLQSQDDTLLIGHDISKEIFSVLDGHPLRHGNQTKVRVALATPLAKYLRTNHVFGMGIFARGHKVRGLNEDEYASSNENFPLPLSESRDGVSICTVTMTRDLYAYYMLSEASKDIMSATNADAQSELVLGGLIADNLLHYLGKKSQAFFSSDEDTEIPVEIRESSEFVKHMVSHVYDVVDLNEEEDLEEFQRTLEKFYLLISQEQNQARKLLWKTIDNWNLENDISEEELSTWDIGQDSMDWFEEAKREYNDGVDIEGVQNAFSRLMDKQTGYRGLDDEPDSDDEDWEDDVETERDDGDGQHFEDAIHGMADNPASSITEDDFFEFFLSGALKLSPEQIEELRSRNGPIGERSNGEGDKTAVDENDDDDAEDLISKLTTLELSENGIDIEDDGESAAHLQESYLQADNALHGPVGALMRNMGLKLPSSPEPSTGKNK